MNKEIMYDIIISVGRIDVKFVPRVVDLITRCLSDVEHISILTHQKYISGINKKLKKYAQCVVLDENKILPELDYGRIKQLITKIFTNDIAMKGWYFLLFL